MQTYEEFMVSKGKKPDYEYKPNQYLKRKLDNYPKRLNDKEVIKLYLAGKLYYDNEGRTIYNGVGK